MIICHNCKGNGFLRIHWEADESIEQCKVCNSSGEIAEEIYYQQSWEDGDGNPVVYHGPPLDGNEFKNYKIYHK